VSQSRIVAIERLDFAFEPKPWAFAVQRRAEIDAYFTKLQSAKPALWNGRVLLMHRYEIAGGILRGAFLETDYASFAAWQDCGRPDVGIYDCFGAAAIKSADGAYLVGVMGAHTYNAGDIYFPCGTPDPKDVVGDKVDFDFSLRRELNEETGLNAGDFDPEPGWIVVMDNELIAAITVLRSPLAGETLRASILDHIAQEKKPELADVQIVRSAADFHPNMRRFVRAFLAHRLSAE
jgi:hypothetical protein